MPNRLKTYWTKSYSDWNYIFREELRTCFRDQGVLIFFLLVPLFYPLLYSFIYTREVVREVPVTVVDDSQSSLSRRYLRHIDATADVRLMAHCANMEEARAMMRRREVYGIIYIPESFSRDLARHEQTSVRIYSDMSGLLYYKALLVANTEVSLAMNAEIKVERAGNTTEQQDKVTEHPIAYAEVSIFNPQNGFAAFLIPAVLVLIIQQTLLLGVGMSAGTAREHNAFRHLIPIDKHHTGLLRILFGKAAAYLLIYIPMSVYVFGVVPHMFSLNQIGAPTDLLLFLIPYIIACIFFAMTVSGLVRHRETCIILVVFSSVPLLFISGVSWPGSAIPELWRPLSYVFPSTFGINGFVRINNSAATLSQVQNEWFALWLQAIAYFFLSAVVYRRSIRSARCNVAQHWRALRSRKTEQALHTP